MDDLLESLYLFTLLNVALCCNRPPDRQATP